MAEIILKGHKVAKGKAQGEALVCQEPISFFGGVNFKTGVITSKGHQLEGVSIMGKILVFPTERGSSMGSDVLYEMTLFETAPKGIINLRAGQVLTLGAIVSNIPMVDSLDANPMEIISSGDHVELDADQGIVIVRKG